MFPSCVGQMAACAFSHRLILVLTRVDFFEQRIRAGPLTPVPGPAGCSGNLLLYTAIWFNTELHLIYKLISWRYKIEMHINTTNMIDEGDCGQLDLKRLHARIFEEHPGTSGALYSTYYNVRNTNCNLTCCIVQILCELGCIAFQICKWI